MEPVGQQNEDLAPGQIAKVANDALEVGERGACVMRVLSDDRSGSRLRLLNRPVARRCSEAGILASAPRGLRRAVYRFQSQDLQHGQLQRVLIADVDQFGLIIGDSRNVRRACNRALLYAEPADRAFQRVAFAGELLEHSDVAAGGGDRHLIAGDHLLVDESMEGSLGGYQVFRREMEIVNRDDYVAS